MTLGTNKYIIILVRNKLEKGEHMEQMGMTDKQFNGFIRFLIDDLKEAKEEEDTEKKNARIQKILENLQSTLED